MAKTIEQERGEILAKRLAVLNEYLLSESDDTFGMYLKGRGITLEAFLKDLPEEFRTPEISTQMLSDEESRENLTEYVEDLNILYYEQYLGYEEKMSADGDNLMDGVIHGEDTGSYYASGKQKRKEKRAEVKKAKAVKKAEKAKIKADKKSGKITGKEARDLKRAARKTLRAKVGSGAGRAIGKLNKFNPATVIMRNSFLSLMSINAAALASAFGQVKRADGKSWKKFVRKWEVFGGDETALKNAINAGVKKKPFPPIRSKKRSAAGGDEEIAKPDEPKNAAPVAAGSAGALVGLAGILASNPATAPAAIYVGSAGGVLAVASPILKEFAKERGADTSNIPEVPMPADVDTGTKEALIETEDEGGLADSIATFFSEYKYWILGGMGILIIGGILLSASGEKE